MKIQLFLMILFISLFGMALPAIAKRDNTQNPFSGEKYYIRKGKAIFANYCSHCHGKKAITEVAARDLRALHQKYGETVDQVFHTTVSTGRAAKGMPSWVYGLPKESQLSDEEIWSVKSYLETLQK